MKGLLELLQKEVPGGGFFPADAPELVVKKVSTGISPLDLILGGGLPRRRLSMVFGDEGHGKSFFAYKLAQSFQQRKLTTVLVDVERCFEPQWAEQLGLKLHDVNTLVIAQPATGEDAADAVTESLKARVDLVVLDSVAALAPAKLLEADAENIFIGLLARLMSPSIGRWQQVNENSVLLLINQIRDVIGTPIHEERMPGGRAQGFAASLKIRVRRRGWLTDKGKRIGFPMFFRVEKTKVPGVIPWSSCEVPFLFDGSLDVVEGLITAAIEKGLIRQDGAHYYLWDKKVYGRNSVVALFRENPDLIPMLLEEAGLTSENEQEVVT